MENGVNCHGKVMEFYYQISVDPAICVSEVIIFIKMCCGDIDHVINQKLNSSNNSMQASVSCKNVVTLLTILHNSL